jgi:hypothetical protein
VKPPFEPAELDIDVESMLSTRTGDDRYPGDSVAVPAPAWTSPGSSGRR